MGSASARCHQVSSQNVCGERRGPTRHPLCERYGLAV